MDGYSPPDSFNEKQFQAALADLGLERHAATGALRMLAVYLVQHRGSGPALSELYSLAGLSNIDLFPCNSDTSDTEQLIRHAVKTGLRNLATRGNINASDPVLSFYAEKLYRPWQLELEMQFLIDGIEPRAHPSVAYFLRGLADMCAADAPEYNIGTCR